MQLMARQPSDNVFQVAFKIPESWLALADEIAAAESRAGLNVTRTDSLRRALWRGLNELRAEQRTRPVISESEFERNHDDVLHFLSDGDEYERDDIAIALNGMGWDARWKGLPRTLNELTKGGFVKRLQGANGFKYKATPKGLAARRSQTSAAKKS